MPSERLAVRGTNPYVTLEDVGVVLASGGAGLFLSSLLGRWLARMNARRFPERDEWVARWWDRLNASVPIFITLGAVMLALGVAMLVTAAVR